MARMKKTSPVAAPEPVVTEAMSETESLLVELGLEVGMEVRVEGESATFTIADIAADGSLWCSSKEGWRAFRAEWCYPATRVNARGNTVPGKMPAERRGSRAAWLSANYPAALAGADPGASAG